MSESLTHLQQMLALIGLEQRAEEQLFKQRIEEVPLGEQRKSGYTWHPLQILSSDTTTGNRLRLEVARTTATDAPQVFQPNAAVVLAVWENGKITERTRGVVTKAAQDKLTVVLDEEELPEWAEGTSLGITLMYDATTYQEMTKALQAVIEARGNRLAELREILAGNSAPSFTTNEHITAPQSLNQRQLDALALVHRAQDVAIVHGPPGTGKTTTLVEIIHQTVAHEKRVLVTAPSNAAADLLAEKLAHKGMRVVRIGNPARVGEELQTLTLDGQIERHPDYKQMLQWRRTAMQLFLQAGKFKRNFDLQAREERKLLRAEAKDYLQLANKTEDYIINDIFAKAQAVVSTVTGAAHASLRQYHFKTVFIDEAAQALEPAAWIAIAKADRVVMAGDHCQLPAVVKSEEAVRKGLAVSLMERCMNGHYGERMSVMLTVQYRMHPDIMAFPSRWFYHNELQAADSIGSEWLDPQLPPLTFIDTAGCCFEEYTDEATGSTSNEAEADLLLRIILQEQELLQRPVAVISPYQAQVKLLRDKCSNYPNIEVNTIDSFQGQEREVVYISLVRSNAEGQIGFLNDLRRSNVAITRAKKRLVIIGDSATLSYHPYYQSLIDFTIEKSYYKSAWEWL
ncbi:AAA domain-containing protein [Rhodoflexus caldus]|uniref:AAA domain-containing protein n=1 Tax=Rhodoflexus caldus TaxID=2891236 RepID=UPI00202A3C57|nr:AAA domain-containing protein [Rhodoflexus caldus]